MPYSIFFTTAGNAVHGTNHRGLGQPLSHGCVRLSVKNAAILWDLVSKRSALQHGGADRRCHSPQRAARIAAPMPRCAQRITTTGVPTLTRP